MIPRSGDIAGQTAKLVDSEPDQYRHRKKDAEREPVQEWPRAL